MGGKKQITEGNIRICV